MREILLHHERDARLTACFSRAQVPEEATLLL